MCVSLKKKITALLSTESEQAEYPFKLMLGNLLAPKYFELQPPQSLAVMPRGLQTLKSKAGGGSGTHSCCTPMPFGQAYNICFRVQPQPQLRAHTLDVGKSPKQHRLQTIRPFFCACLIKKWELPVIVMGQMQKGNPTQWPKVVLTSTCQPQYLALSIIRGIHWLYFYTSTFFLECSPSHGVGGGP